MHGLTIDDTAQIAGIKEAITMLGGGMPEVTISGPSLLPFDYDYVAS